VLVDSLSCSVFGARMRVCSKTTRRLGLQLLRALFAFRPPRLLLLCLTQAIILTSCSLDTEDRPSVEMIALSRCDGGDEGLGSSSISVLSNRPWG
jgi:hypothetical protein